MYQIPWCPSGIGTVLKAATHICQLPYVRIDLSAASRVCLMEPQWNLAIEEQALARVYRLGQTQPVVIVRFFIKKSNEEVS